MCLKFNPSYFCSQCLKEIDFEPHFNCLVCNKRLNHEAKCQLHSQLIEKLISFGVYEESKLKEKILKAKNYGYSEVFFDLGRVVGNLIKNFDLSDYTLAYVPLTSRKYFERGFNQAEVLALGIKEILNLPLYSGIKKIKETKDQSELSFEERKTNLQGAFSLISPPPPKVILIDDIKTTGQTLLEISKILKQGGAKKIIALTILR